MSSPVHDPRGWPSSIGDFLVDHPSCDWALGLTAGVLVWASGIAGAVTIKDHSVFYQTLGGIAIGLFGFGTVVMTLMATVTPTPRLAHVLTEVGERLVKLIFASLANLGLVTVLLLVPWLVDGQVSSDVLGGIVSSLVMALCSSAGRLVWLLYRIVEVALRVPR